MLRICRIKSMITESRCHHIKELVKKYIDRMIHNINSLSLSSTCCLFSLLTRAKRIANCNIVGSCIVISSKCNFVASNAQILIECKEKINKTKKCIQNKQHYYMAVSGENFKTAHFQKKYSKLIE